jgi:2-desacetyl-2-hydroxyethyl bacteriochlorophyllide A dehydrogenase
MPVSLPPSPPRSTVALTYWLQGPGQLVSRTEPLEPPPGSRSWVQAETLYSAISPGTELAAWQGKPPLRPSRAYPRLLGYCNVAEIVATGPDVGNVQPGDVVLTHQSHRSAFVCDAAEALLCAPDREPAFLRSFAALYLYHLGYSALLAGEFRPGFEVAVIGLGTLGRTTAELVKVLGGTPLLFTEQDAAPLAAAGLNHVFPKKYPGEKWCDARHDMGGVDLVINTSNAWPDHLLGLQLARRGGTIVYLGFPGRGLALPDFNPLDSQYFYDKQLTLRHCGHVAVQDAPAIDQRFTLRRNLRYLLDLQRSGRIDPTALLSFELPATELAQAYTLLGERRSPAYTALLRWKS